MFNIRAAQPEGGSGDSQRVVAGYAAVFNAPSEDMGFVEFIAPGAFTQCLGDDVRCLFNHDPNLLLARTSSGTLRLSQDDRGLRYEFEVPDTTFGRDFHTMVQRGDVSQSSFGFSVSADEWAEQPDGKWHRTITQVGRLFDVSPVTYPAYPDTEVALRSLSGLASAKRNESESGEPLDGPENIFLVHTGQGTLRYATESNPNSAHLVLHPLGVAFGGQNNEDTRKPAINGPSLRERFADFLKEIL